MEDEFSKSCLDKWWQYRRRVLLTEDNAFNQEIAVELLELVGLEVICAENGQIALDTFTNSDLGYFDVILMDIQTPIMDGHDATRAIRASQHKKSNHYTYICNDSQCLHRRYSHGTLCWNEWTYCKTNRYRYTV